jgi:uncharacterized integral membrane protein
MAEEPTQPGPQAPERNISPQLVAGVLIGVLLVVFVFQNTDDVPIQFLWFDWSPPLWLALLANGLAAIATAELVGIALRRRRRRRD